MTTLVGLTIPTQINPRWDHVYVTSDTAHAWNCFGRSNGGTQICSGQGDAALAECLSHPQGRNALGIPLYAGLAYGVDGVCHQAANRILYAANPTGLVLVDQARGYRFSATLFGTFGRGTLVPWPQLSHCHKLGQRVASAVPSEGLNVTPNDNKSSKLAGDILQIYAHADPPTGELAIARAELEALVRAQLGADYSQRKIAEVAQSQRSWRQSQRLLTERLERGELPWEEYIASVRDLTSVMANRCEAILGAADFERLFGIPAKDAPDLFSPLYPEPDESAS